MEKCFKCPEIQTDNLKHRAKFFGGNDDNAGNPSTEQLQLNHTTGSYFTLLNDRGVMHDSIVIYNASHIQNEG